MAGDIDPNTQREAPDTTPPGGLPADLNAALSEQFRNEMAQQTQQSGAGAAVPGLFNQARDLANRGVKWVDTLGGLDTAGRKMRDEGRLNSIGFIDPNALVPQTGGELLANSAALVPGMGPGASLLRIATAGAGGYIGDTLTGSNPTGGAIKGVAGQALGEAGGAAGGALAAHRFKVGLANEKNPLSDSVLIPAAIASEVPAFAHVRTPNDVQQLAVQGQGRLSKMYQFSMDSIIRQTGDPMVNVPSIAELRGLMTGAPAASGATTGPVTNRPGMAAALGIGGGTPQGQPSQMPLSEALRFVQSSGEAAFAGPRTPETVRLRQLWRQAQDEIGASLPSRVQAPNGTTVNIANFYTKTKNEYSTGQSIIGALNSRGDGAKSMFTVDGRRVIFNQTAEPNGGTPFQRAMFEVSQDLHPSATAAAAHRGGELGTGDSAATSFPLWLRSKGLEGLGASIHSAFPRNPQFAGERQPVTVPGALRTVGGQGAVNQTLHTLLPGQ
jgi:hypothetical protein